MAAKIGDLASKTMTRYINVSVNGVIPSLFMGAGFAHAIEKKSTTTYLVFFFYRFLALVICFMRGEMMSCVIFTERLRINTNLYIFYRFRE